MSGGMKIMFGSPTLYQSALKMAPLANYIPSFLTNINLNVWCKYHTMPEFGKSFHQLWKSGKVKGK
jgi:L-lactate dehydrogenase complex protein LldF